MDASNSTFTGDASEEEPCGANNSAMGLDMLMKNFNLTEQRPTDIFKDSRAVGGPLRRATYSSTTIPDFRSGGTPTFQRSGAPEFHASGAGPFFGRSIAFDPPHHEMASPYSRSTTNLSLNRSLVDPMLSRSLMMKKSPSTSQIKRVRTNLAESEYAIYNPEEPTAPLNVSRVQMLSSAEDRHLTDDERAFRRKMKNFKTELCRKNVRGECPYGPQCHYAHDVTELRSKPPESHTKTQLCRNFELEGECRYAGKCRFIHRRM